MSERAVAIEPETLKIGLLMESAQVQQKLAHTALETLRTHTQDLDKVVREEIRRTFIEELRTVTAEIDGAMRALRAMRRAANMRNVLWSAALAVLCTAIPCAIARWALPSAASVAALRVQRDALTRGVTELEQRGGKAQWRNCGDPGRLCVRIDRKAAVYGDNADYYIVKGY